MQSKKNEITKNSKGTDSVPVRIKSIYDCKIPKKIKEYGKSRTDQQFKHDANPNKLMKDYQQTGTLGNGLGTRTPLYANCTGADFREMQTKVAQAQQQFDNLPSAIRNKFGNNVDEMLDFLKDETNRSKAEKMGLIEKKEPTADPADAPLTLNQLKTHQKDPFTKPVPEGDRKSEATSDGH